MFNEKRRPVVKKRVNKAGKTKALSTPNKAVKIKTTMRISSGNLLYFKALAKKTGVSYQNLMDSYLSDCVATRRVLKTKWMPKK
jgi:hypothetical protein